MNHKTNPIKGFTLVELMLAMSFVSVLFMAVAMTVLHVGNTYNRGLTIKAVNQSGRDISDSLRRDVSASRHTEITYINGATAGAGGLHRLCLGSVTYVWNYGNVIEDGSASRYTDSNQPIVFARTSDSGGEACKQVGSTYPSSFAQAETTELLENQNLRLAVHNFTFTPVVVDEASDQAAYSASFTLGTNDQATLATGNQQCRPPDDDESNLDFCAVNTFDMIIRAGGAL